ncbi:MAG: MarR family transcriptional regulator [Pseudohongiellaceae bacterium]
MNQANILMADEVIVALRRVIRSVELHSRNLVSTHGLTAPQATLLRALTDGPITAGGLATRVNLSQGTVTDILNRLEQRGLITRERDEEDRRRVIVDLTDKSRTILKSSPPLLQTRFTSRFNALEDWEQSLLLASLQRIAHMMDADDIVVPPVLTGESGIHSEDDVAELIKELAVRPG